MTATQPAVADASQGRWVLVSTILASSMAFIDGTALNVALPAIQAAFHATGAALLWVVNAYLVMLAALILLGGSLGDEFGRKRIYMVGISLFVLASLACGVSPSIEFLIVARAVAGVGGALMIPGSLAILSAYFQSGERGRAIGTWSAVTTMVTLAGPVLGGVLSNAGLWRGVFLINFPIGVATLAVLHFRVPESRGEQGPGHIDWVGALLAAIGLAAVTYGFISAPGLGFRDPGVAAPLAAGLVALAAFVVAERTSPHPMMPLGLFRSHTFSGANLLTLFLYGALSVGTFFLSLDLVQAQGYSLAAAGFAFTPFAVILTILSRSAGGLADRVGARPLLVVGPAVVGVGFLVMAFAGLTGGPADYWLTFFPGIVLLGVGMGITVAPLTTAVMNAVVTDLSGTASGINNAVSRTAGALAIAIGGSVALLVFAGALAAHLAGLGLPAAAVSALLSGAAQLGALAVPAQVPPESAGVVADAIKLAFVDTFKVIMVICAVLCWLAALMAGRTIRRREPAAGAG